MKKIMVTLIFQMACLTSICSAFDPLALERLESVKECEKCNFEKAQLNGADLSGIVTNDSDFSYANLVGAKLGESKHSNFTGADLTNAFMEKTNLDEAVFENANLTSANMTEAYIHHADFRGANLTNAKLVNATLGRGDFRRANLTNADLRKATVDRVDFRDTNLTNANFTGIKFEKNLFTGASAKGAIFSFSDLTNHDLSKIDLEGASFIGALLDNTNLVGSNINKTDFTGADLRYTYYGKQTLFDPQTNQLAEFKVKITKSDLLKSKAIFDSSTRFSD